VDVRLIQHFSIVLSMSCCLVKLSDILSLVLSNVKTIDEQFGTAKNLNKLNS
jgi:hypothetical protein